MESMSAQPHVEATPRTGAVDPFACVDAEVPAVGRKAAEAWLGANARTRLAAMLRSREIRIAAPRVYFRSVLHANVLCGPHWLVPSPRAVASAFCAERGWRMAPGQTAAENGMGLSTQVPAKHLVAADGCRERMFLYGGRILVEPGPELAFHRSPAAALLIQATRSWQRGRSFSFPPVSTQWSERRRTVRQVAGSIASRAMPSLIRDLETALAEIPQPYRRLAGEIIRIWHERQSAHT